MRTLQRVVEFLKKVPMGAPADGGRIGVGLDAAMDAQRARVAQPPAGRIPPAAGGGRFARAA